ncbi:D-2-hydroxyacid dehydrogenase [Spirosoma sp. KUDC1026]|uniref:D-2-hydroxyacid dehydrogenase n=1 Tax=Spirosoma sp. KUDC1026 TaxID=2745947 RepID=UPI00159B872F|nr:D-2-hydroxyacid dehydrogenase [Spirosoma sp. KUDC1026]QKZ11888.1 D-2-hydroxyacid dehydrogenase [Spirosoma sp. KUDC1026]
MKLVYTDAYTLNPGDLDWAPIEALGDVTFYDRTAPDQLIERIRDAELVLVNKVKINRETLGQLPNLRYIGVTATGYDIIDLAAAKERGIVVTNVRGYSSDSVAQLTFALLLELTLQVGRHSISVHEGDWVASPDFSYSKSPLVELAGKTMGLVGYGDIGKSVAAIAKAFGMNVLVNRRHPRQEADDRTQYVDLETLFSQSDVVSLHCPSTPDTIGFVDKNLLSLMKPSAYLINTSRGNLINESDLAAALNNGRLAGAGLDVLAAEPPKADNPLLMAKNCIITPHIAWASQEARQRLMHLVADNVRAFLTGQPQNVVNS